MGLRIAGGTVAMTTSPGRGYSRLPTASDHPMHKPRESTNDLVRALAESFLQLDEHLRPLRIGTLGGITALRSQLDRLRVAAFAADNEGRYVAVNRAAADLTGMTVWELETKSVWEMTPDVDARAGERLWTAFLSTGEQRGTYTLATRRGTIDVVYLSRAHVLPNIHVSLLLRA